METSVLTVPVSRRETDPDVAIVRGRQLRESGVDPGRGVVDGQAFERATINATFKGEDGTLVIRGKETVWSAGGDYSVSSGTWKVVSGTGQYEKATGGGRYAGVILNSTITKGWTRLEGYLTTP